MTEKPRQGDKSLIGTRDRSVERRRSWHRGDRDHLDRIELKFHRGSELIKVRSTIAHDCRSVREHMDGISIVREPVEETVSRGVRRMGWIASKLRRMWSWKYIPVAVLLIVSSGFLVLQMNSSFVVIPDEDDFDLNPLPATEDPGTGLTNSIRKARRIASGSASSSLEWLSPDDLSAWNDRHPCQSRGPDGLLSFYSKRKDPAESLPANPVWDDVFEEYSNLHRQCMRKIGDIGDYLLQRNTTSGCKFVVADVADQTEFGDKILVLASTLLYAILTQRVILIPRSTLVPSYMCEPFAGSSWLLNSSSFPLRPVSFWQKWQSNKEIFSGTDWRKKCCSAHKASDAEEMESNEWQPLPRFYCTLEQVAYSKATFIYLSGIAYTIPKLFAAPVFRPTLEALFPDRVVLPRLLRSAFLPGNAVWKRVQGLENGYLRPGQRLIGIEARYYWTSWFGKEETNRIVNKRITDCLTQSDILPSVVDTWEAHTPAKTEPTPVFHVLVSSLYLSLKDHLAKIYERSPTSTGEAVGVVQVSQTGITPFSVEADVEAFKEALLLSFSDQLLVTPQSSVGSLAHSYGALVPWFIEVRQDGWFTTYGTCQRGQTIEVCNQFAKKRYSCSSDSSVNGKLIADVVPYVGNCLPIDRYNGIQLITSSQKR